MKSLIILASISLFSFLPAPRTVIYSEDGEGSTLFSGAAKQTTTTYGITKVHGPMYHGDSCIRFELRESDAMNNSGTRAEIVYPEAVNLERWYGFALMFDYYDYDYDSEDEVVMQWHQAGGQTPALCFRTRGGNIWLRVMGTTWIDLGPLKNGYWAAYTMHVIHSSSSTGLIEIWRNGIKIILKMSKSAQNTFSVDEIVQIIRDRMYTMGNGRQPRDGSNSRLYDLIYFFEHGHDDPSGHFSEIAPEPINPA